jgi:inner membrane protein
MFIPIGFVLFVKEDRQNRWRQVIQAESQQEGGPQTVVGPILIIPTERDEKNAEGKVVTLRGEAVVFAETGAAEATIDSETRVRGMYKVPVYRSKTTLTATFDRAAAAAALAQLDANTRVQWANARLILGFSNAIAVQETVMLTLTDGSTREFKPYASNIALNAPLNSMPENSITSPAAAGSFGIALIAAPVGDVLPPAGAWTVNTALALTGAERFAVAAFAKNTTAKISGDWADPSFEGVFRRSEVDVSAAGFSAQWTAPFIRRGLADVGFDTGLIGQAANQDFAVRFVQPTNAYTGVDRALKYAMMFIGLVFLAYFLFEIVSGQRAHPAQYIMVGLSQAIFYLLLLAFAERVGFTPAFLGAAAATILLISSYATVVFRGMAYFVPALLVFTIVYGLAYVLMTMEDYALMVGALISFAALAALMFVTRKVAWYGADGQAGSRPA